MNGRTPQKSLNKATTFTHFLDINTFGQGKSSQFLVDVSF